MGEPEVTVRAAIEVEAAFGNTGPRAGSATLFLFLRDPVASVARPVLELRRFVKVDLAAGESRRSASPWNGPTSPSSTPALQPVVEPGRFELHLGLSADPQAFGASASFWTERVEFRCRARARMGAHVARSWQGIDITLE